MREGNDQSILIEDNVFLGINLGADYCSEHEWGIENIRHDFGMSDKGYGIAKRIITKLPPTELPDNTQYNFNKHLIKHDSKNKHYIIYDSVSSIDHTISEGKHYKLHLFKSYNGKDNIDSHLATAWDKGSFGILTDKSLSHHLDDLYNAFLNKDIAIFLGGGGPFRNSGLVLSIASRIPKQYINEWEARDKDNEKLKNTAKSIGIEEILSKAGKKYFALSPAWADKDKYKTDYPVVFWLNPMEQQIHNFGWFSVEDLMLWAVNNGPIPK